MNRPAYLRVLSLLLLLCLLSPTAALAFGDGKKFFKEGMKHEIAEEWDKAAELFAQAVGENPKNPEYRLHLQRSLFFASQQYMAKGRAAADEKDYAAAYTYFRKAYAFDPVNELAKSEMARMVRMQEGLLKGDDKDPKTDAQVKFTQTGFNPADDVKMPQKFEKLRDVPFPSGVNLTFLVKELAKDLELNVLFDTDSRLDARQVKIELKNVTAAKALDYIFLQESLFFQKVGPRTILVASNQRRTNFQQLVLRTFYLANANPKDVKTIIQTAIPPQPGRTQTIVVEDASTNSLTIRDTAENIALFEKLIGSLDKDRAEVVMDVAIYEVSKSDLLELGNQIGSRAQLTNLGGTTRGVVGLGGNELFGSLTRAIGDVIPSVFGAGIVLPASNLVAFQAKGNTKLLASTQIHAFNNEDSSARIGQRVPVKTATYQTGNTTQGGVVADVINYEQVGLTLKFKPIVFPNQDVQVAMDIESKDVVSGGTTENPIFSERKIVGTARVQNNKTLLLASVAQDVESRGRSGLPLLGLIPILGRLFSAPTRDNRQVDIVIAVTPRVIRAPAILPDDLIERPTGSMALPTSGSLEAMIIQEERGEQLAMARRLPTNTAVQLPDQPAAPGYVRGAQPEAPVTSSTAPEKSAENAVAASTGLNLKPIDTSAKSLDIRQTSDTRVAVSEPKAAETKQTLSVDPSSEVRPALVRAASVELSLPSFFKEMKRGDKVTIPVMVKSSASFRSAMLGLKFDPEKIAVRTVTFGDVFGELSAAKTVTPYLNQGGKMFVSLSLENGVAPSSFGILAYVEIEALSDGKPMITLEKEALNFLSADGKTFAVKF
ncbi:MAG: secretin N-terminal domain-containing protein [bacterium]|nr:secretin N-terminal domain-containing protein [bacterium]